MLTARLIARAEGEHWLMCGHPRCRGQLGWLTWRPEEIGGPAVLRSLRVFVRERVSCPCDVDMQTRFLVQRPYSDQQGQPGEPEGVFDVDVSELPRDVNCPRRGCGRRSVITRELVESVKADATAGRPSRRGGERRRGYLTLEI